jgi:hypothetical protein
VRDVCHGDQVATRAIVMQHRTQRPVQFEITQATPGRPAGVDQEGRAEAGGLPVPQPASRLAASGHQTVRPGSSGIGSMSWVSTAPSTGRTRCAGPGDADLPTHQEPACCAAAPRALQAGVDSEVPRHRGR